MNLVRRSAAEFLGTFWLVLGGCGASLLSGKFPFIAAGIVGVALAFGLALASGMYALGNVSGGHFNPAVTLGLAVARRFPSREVVPYWLAQVAGGAAAALVLYLIASDAPGFDAGAGRFAANGFNGGSPGLYGLLAAAVTEVVMTFLLVMVVLGSTDALGFKGFAPLAIGLALTAIHLVSIPVTGTSVNPARSTGPALVAGGRALAQLWLFWTAPLAGSVLAGVLHPALTRERTRERPRPEVEPAPERGAGALPPGPPAPPRQAAPAR